MPRSGSDFGREHLRSLGRRLRELRGARSWSLKRLSAECGVSVAAIQKIESGDTNPNLLTVLAIADVLGESVDRLVAASRKASQISNVVRGALPLRSLGASTLPALDHPRVKGRLIALAGRASLEKVRDSQGRCIVRLRPRRFAAPAVSRWDVGRIGHRGFHPRDGRFADRMEQPADASQRDPLRCRPAHGFIDILDNRHSRHEER